VSDASLRNLNGHIVRLFQEVSPNVKVMGMAGYDAATVQGEPIGDNYTGQPTKLNDAWLRHVLNGTGDARVIPVIYPICKREQGAGPESRLNINADDVASFIATELEARRLILASDIPGVLDKDKVLIPEMSTTGVDRLVGDGTVSGGMIPKLRAAAEAANAMRDGGVVILDGREPETILAELLGKGGGTLIQRPATRYRPR
jgi:acetylglutamate kinase